MARITLKTHWKFLRLARVLESAPLARGVLETLWEPCWAAGDPYLGTSGDIEALCEWRGKPGALTQALLTAGGTKSAGFIEPYEGRLRDTAEPHYQVHDFFQHCPTYVRLRRNAENGAYPKTCLACGAEFFASHPRALYCKQACRQAAYRRSVTALVTHPLQSDASVKNSGRVTDRDALVTDRDRRVTVPLSRTVTATVTSAVTPSMETPVNSSDVTEPVTHPLRSDATTSLAKPSQYVRTCVVGSATSLTRVAPATEPVTEEDVPGLEINERDVDDGVERKVKDLERTSAAQSDEAIAPTSPASAVVMSFPVVGQGGPAWHLRDDQVAEWRALYPDLDVVAQARHALAWIAADKSRRKTVRGMAKFLVSWFNRSTDAPRSRGPTLITGSLKTAGNKAAIAEFLKGRGYDME